MASFADPVTSKNRGSILSGLATLGVGLFSAVQVGLGLYKAFQPTPSYPTPNASTTHTVARPIIEQTARFFSNPAGFAANSAVRAALPTTPSLHGLGARASSAAGTAFTAAKGLSWTTLGLVGFVGSLGALYLAHRYWSSPSPLINNENHNNINIHIHVDGKSDIKRDGTNIYVKMPKVPKCGKKEFRDAARAAS